MTKKTFSWINLSIASLCILFLVLGFFFMAIRSTDIVEPEVLPEGSTHPKHAFKQPEEAYDAIGEPFIELEFSPWSIQLPDLRNQLIFYGRNGRPDADPLEALMHFAFIGNKSIASTKPGERLYLIYDKNQSPSKYLFSPDNSETSLWIEATPQENNAIINVGMKNDQGQEIHQPKERAEFELRVKEFARFGGIPWEIGKIRVDGTLLARQKARWYGKDLFMDKHGGEEYQDFQGKNRIDFGEKEDLYSVYVNVNDNLVWEDEKWRVVEPGPDSLGKPLLHIKKADERLMNFEFWDLNGKGKVILNLLKSSETWMPQNLQRNFKFVGARTRSQFVFEIDGKRVLLSPKEWLLLTDQGWKQLVSPEDIDNYVERKTIGPLFIFDGIGIKGNRQVLEGTIFNSSRSAMQQVELPLLQGAGSYTSTEEDGENLEEDEDEYDEDDEDLDEIE